MTQLYFAYGSNLSLKQIVKRCQTSKPYTNAKLLDHALVFHMFSETVDGGAAGLETCEESIVEGVVYEMSDDDLLLMDGFESVDVGCYTRKKITVICPDGTELECWTYFSNGQIGADYPPSSQYLGRILTGAKEHALSPAYIQKLEDLPLADKV